MMQLLDGLKIQLQTAYPNIDVVAVAVPGHGTAIICSDPDTSIGARVMLSDIELANRVNSPAGGALSLFWELDCMMKDGGVLIELEIWKTLSRITKTWSNLIEMEKQIKSG